MMMRVSRCPAVDIPMIDMEIVRRLKELAQKLHVTILVVPQPRRNREEFPLESRRPTNDMVLWDSTYHMRDDREP